MTGCKDRPAPTPERLAEMKEFRDRAQKASGVPYSGVYLRYGGYQAFDVETETKD